MATSQPRIETVSSGMDIAKLIVSLLLVVGGIVAFFMLSARGELVQWVALLVGVCAALGVFAVSENGRQFLAFGRDSWRELKKVVWPARKEAIQITGYVFAFAVVMSLFLWLTDKTLEWALFDLVLGWRK